MIHRDIERLLLKGLRQMPIVTLTGPRQCGKTTLVRNALPKYRYVNLEELDNREEARMDPRGFLERLGHKVILDEVQNAPDLLSYIQVRVDDLKRKGQYVLTGSQNLLMLAKVSQSLAGRTFLLDMLPLSVGELHAAGLLPKRIDDLILKGSYPRLYDQRIDRQAWYRAYVRTYIERDVRQVVNIRDLDTFGRFLRLCAGRTGQLLNHLAISNELGVDAKTVQHWTTTLEASYVLFLLRPHHANFNKRLVKTPRLYFHDTGLACALLGIQNTATLQHHHLRGALFENAVIADLVKQRWNTGQDHDLYFWRDNTGNEVDIIRDGPKPEAIEVKSSSTLHGSMFDGLRYYRAAAKNKKLRCTLVHNGPRATLVDGIRSMDWRSYLVDE